MYSPNPQREMMSVQSQRTLGPRPDKNVLSGSDYHFSSKSFHHHGVILAFRKYKPAIFIFSQTLFPHVLSLLGQDNNSKFRPYDPY